MNIDVENLKQDLINYFSTAINPFDVDLKGLEEIENVSLDELIELATKNGFNLKLYEKEANKGEKNNVF